MLDLPNEIQFRLFNGLKEETVAIVGLAITEEDESELMAGIIEQFLLKGQFAALQGHLGSTAAIGEGFIHGATRIHH